MSINIVVPIVKFLIALLALLGVYPMANGQDSADPLFEIIEPPADLSPAQSAALAALRERPGVVRVGLVRLRFAPAQRAQPGAKIAFNLFPDTTVELSFAGLERQGEQGYIWRGGNSDIRNTATLAVHGENIVGNVRWEGKLYQISPLGGGLHTVAEIDQSVFKID
jgi:hypothetical protein